MRERFAARARHADATRDAGLLPRRRAPHPVLTHPHLDQHRRCACSQRSAQGALAVTVAAVPSQGTVPDVTPETVTATWVVLFQPATRPYGPSLTVALPCASVVTVSVSSW